MGEKSVGVSECHGDGDVAWRSRGQRSNRRGRSDFLPCPRHEGIQLGLYSGAVTGRDDRVDFLGHDGPWAC